MLHMVIKALTCVTYGSHKNPANSLKNILLKIRYFTDINSSKSTIYYLNSNFIKTEPTVRCREMQ